MWLSFSILEGRPINLFDLEFAVDCLYGAAYGAVTAIVAWKLKSNNNALQIIEDSLLDEQVSPPNNL